MFTFVQEDCKTQICTIGDHIAGSEIPELWVESGIAIEGVTVNVLNGDYKLGLRLHRIIFRAAWRFLLPKLMLFIEEPEPDLYGDLNALQDL